MTVLLNRAFKKASHLPESIQNALAEELLQEIENEIKWDNTLKKSQGVVENLADEALKDHKAGKTRRMGIDEL